MRPGNELRAQRNRSRCGKLDFVERLDEVPTTSDDHSDDSREQSLGMLASMIADRVDLALDWGYPAFDEALFA